MSSHKNHPFHLVDYSPWPILGAFSVLILMVGFIKWFHYFNYEMFLMSIMIVIMIMYQWWRDIVREGTFQGLHSYIVTMGLRWGMILFIISEIFFFISFFWGFFHSSLSPSIDIGMNWPPLGIQTFNPIEIPLLNTIILLSSGLSVTWTHHSLMENNYSQALQGLLITIILGIYFTILQAYEYMEASFTIADSVYGSSFFMATGFHGLHVIIGTTFLAMCLIRHMKNHFSQVHHFGFEAAAWYWHFVDVVWLFLYISIYWWGK
uniref:Cytochrome c oxidase subunit 3 n=1 Tax=Stegobium paniceum TaxID=295656 RepID=A0A4P8D2M0_STEPN|nr:cytochrome c oxidase subunit III [Stegobium paniceum]